MIMPSPAIHRIGRFLPCEKVLLMRGVLLGSALLALILTVLIVGVVRLTGMVVRRIWGRTKNLKRFAE